MAKGFGTSKQGDLGYVLLLFPEMKVYAADLSMGEDDEEFIGITNDLESAQVWKKKSEVRQAVGKYIGILDEEFGNRSEIKLAIKKLKRLTNGKLKDEAEEDIILGKNSTPNNS